jgi:ribosomal protein S18 acetylase RimI-like enzyme
MTSKKLSPVIIRPAQANDSALAAKIMYLSMGGLADHLFDQDAKTIEAFIAKLFKRNAGRFGHKIAVVAEMDGQPVGMLISCAGANLNQLNLTTLFHFFSVTGIKQALKFIWRGIRLPGGKEAEKDEYYISNLGILPSAQGCGIGSYLLEYAEQMGRAIGLYKCSLIVGLHNKNAFRLYERRGFQIMDTVHDQNENLGYYRMVTQLV